jgi:hypothetical protein
MPEYAYADQVPRSYTETRDAAGDVIGTVEPGDRREFGAGGEEKPEGAPGFWPAPDARWVPAGEQVPPPWPGVSADMYRRDPEAAGAGLMPDGDHGSPALTPPLTPPGPVTPPVTPITPAAGQEDED